VAGWLLDTNILSELRRPKPEPKVTSFITAQPLDLLYVSTVTFAEIRFGIELAANPGHRAELNDWLTHKVRPMFKWRLMVEDGRKAGHTYSQPGLIIAATAARHGLVIVTRDAGDYRHTQVPLFNPWIDRPPGSAA
jgi:predicted nucleic acid-binding protein